MGDAIDLVILDMIMPGMDSDNDASIIERCGSFLFAVDILIIVRLY